MSVTRHADGKGIATAWGFLRETVAEVGLPRVIIASFLLFLFVLAYFTKMSLGSLLSDSLVRVGMNGVMVLAMVPSIACGAGLNFGLPLGIICGLVATLVTIEFDMRGFAGFFAAIAMSLPLTCLIGIAYAWLLDKVHGQEMMVGTYAGFAIVALMAIFWLMAPFTNPELVWAIGGKGLRYTLSLGNFYGKCLNNFLKLRLGTLTVPLGLLGFFWVLCSLLWLFFQTKAGTAMIAAGSNPAFAKASGIEVGRSRTLGITLSTVLGGVGIIVYAQSFGFLQLYMAPLMMAFPAVAAVLIGGASLRRATIVNVLVGTFLFQTLLTVALPVTSNVIQGDISETARMIVSNGMILYALTRATGGN